MIRFFKLINVLKCFYDFHTNNIQKTDFFYKLLSAISSHIRRTYIECVGSIGGDESIIRVYYIGVWSCFQLERTHNKHVSYI